MKPKIANPPEILGKTNIKTPSLAYERKAKRGKGQSGIGSAALRGLSAWFERQKRVLPWRDAPTLYRVWISEIMLQQTQVKTVIPYFERFLARFPSVEDLAAASLEEVLRHWAGLGYYSRAKNLHKAARLIVQNGGFPLDREGWLKIPGVGHYTAGAILSIALNLPEAILDGNVERVLSRMRCVGREDGDGIFKQRLWDLSRTVVQRSFKLALEPRVINQALMELGAMICLPKNPKCAEKTSACPFASDCQALKNHCTDDYPPRRKAKTWVNVDEHQYCVLDDNNRVLLRLRNEGEWRAGLWDLPETLPVGPKAGRFLGKIKTRHVVTHHKITRVTEVLRIKKARLAQNLRWISLTSPEAEVPVGAPLKKVLSQVQVLLAESSAE